MSVMAIKTVKPHEVASGLLPAFEKTRKSVLHLRLHRRKTVHPKHRPSRCAAGMGSGKPGSRKVQIAVSLDGVPLARNHQRLAGFISERGVETALASALATSRLWYESPIG